MTKLPGAPTWQPGYDEAQLHLPDTALTVRSIVLEIPKEINERAFSLGISKKFYFLLQDHGGINKLLSQYHEERGYIDRSLDEFFYAVLGVSRVEAKKITTKVMNNSRTNNDSDFDDEIPDDEVTELEFE